MQMKLGVTDNNHACICKQTHINTCAEARRCLEVDRYLIWVSGLYKVSQKQQLLKVFYFQFINYRCN